jgi:hypothetical protein
MPVARIRGIISLVAILAVFVVVASGCVLLSKKRDRQTAVATPSAAGGSVAVFSSDVMVYEPLSGEEVKDSFVISGRAVDGIASVSIAIEDDSSVPFATSTLTVNSGYFKGTVKIFNPPTRSGNVVVSARMADNSAGSRITVPVIFGTYSGRTVSVFFSNIEKDPTLKNCAQVYPVIRNVKLLPGIEENALKSLLIGPTDSEVSQGFVTNFPEYDVALLNIEHKGNTYTVNFNKSLQEGVRGACRIQALRAQIEQTVKQFVTSSAITITVDGKPGIF